MAIQMHIQHDHHTPEMPVFVDMLNRMNEPDVASEALVLMVVGLQ